MKLCKKNGWLEYRTIQPVGLRRRALWRRLQPALCVGRGDIWCCSWMAKFPEGCAHCRGLAGIPAVTFAGDPPLLDTSTTHTTKHTNFWYLRSSDSTLSRRGCRTSASTVVPQEYSVVVHRSAHWKFQAVRSNELVQDQRRNIGAPGVAIYLHRHSKIPRVPIFDK